MKTKNNDYIFSLFQKFINIITGIITISLVNRYLGASLKGEYEYILNLVNVLYIVLGLGLYSSYPYMKRHKLDNQLHKYLDMFFLQAFIYAVIGTILIVVTKEIKIFIIVFLTILKVLNTQLQNVGIVEFIRFRQKIQILSYVMDLVLTLFVYFIIPQNMNILLLILSAKFIVSTILYLIKAKYIPNPFKIDNELFKKILKFGFVAMLTALLSEFNYSIDIFVMRFLLPFSEIGLYSVGSKLAQYIWLIPDSFKDVLFSRTAQDDSINEIKVVLRLNIFITFVLIILMLVMGKFIIWFLYGTEYLDSYIVTSIVFLGIPSMVIYKIICPLYIAKGQQKKIFSILLVSVISNVILNLITIPMFGKIGAAASTVCSYSICGLILFICFIKEYKLKWTECIIIKKTDFKKIINRIRRKNNVQV